ncbi:MAG TPA: hypothetical protein VHZ81_12690 [Galbitalea sp.]|nr:hypothetical protein [Galbitalea sp.]
MSAEDAKLVAEYRRLIRWYPKRWRAANGDALLGALLDHAEDEGRLSPSTAERSAIARAGLAQRFGLAGTSSSRLTLSLGGVAVILATVVPLVGRLVFIFPQPIGSSWLYYSWQPFFAPLSTSTLVVAFVILAAGFRNERGIAGMSVLGKTSLIVFAVAGLAQSVTNAALIPPLSTLGASRWFGEAVGDALWFMSLLSLAALIVASIVVARAGVLRGPARWALVAVAIAIVGELAIDEIPLPAFGAISVWGSPVALMVQLATGLLYLLSGLATSGEPLAGRSGSELPLNRYASR